MNFKTLKDPLERHHLILNWNFDDEDKVLHWIVEQPDTDLGTIILLYWLLQPSYFKENPDSNIKDISKSSIDLISKIEQNVQNNFYTNKNYAADPTNLDGTNFLSEVKPETLKLIPKLLQTQLNGLKIEREPLTIKYVNKIYPLDQKQRQKLNNMIDKGIGELKKIMPNITRESSPDEIIKTINDYSLTMRPPANQDKRKFTRSEQAMLKNMDMVYGEQVCRKANWKWHIYELREQVLDFAQFALVSPDQKHMWHPFDGFTRYFSERNYSNKTRIIEEFNDITNIENFFKRKIAEAREGIYTKKEYEKFTDQEILIKAYINPHDVSQINRERLTFDQN